jgi:hypothetical protein
MSVHFRIDPGSRLVSYVVEGDATADEAREFLDAVLAHPEYRRGFNFLGDRREVDRAPGTRYVHVVAAEVNARCKALGRCRWAVVVSGELADGMARMWGQMTGFSGVEIRAFRSVESACEWLGVVADRAPPSAAPPTVPDNTTVELPVPPQPVDATVRQGHGE